LEINLREQAIRYGTPFYLFDFDRLAEQVRTVRNIMGDKIRLCFAMKANPMLIKGMDSLVDCFEVCSPGEFRICEKEGIRREKIVLSGVYKEEQDIRDVMEKYGDAGIFTAESEAQFLLLEKLSRECGIRPEVLLRLSSGNQFGMDESTVKKIIAGQKEKSGEGPRITGIQLYGGTQTKKPGKFEEEIHKLDCFLSELEEECGFRAEKLEYGPGLGVNYFEKDKPLDQEELLGHLSAALHDMRFKAALTLEMGRFLCASCGTYVTKIADMKENDGVKYAICDGGIHHLNYYGQTLAMQIPFHEQIAGDGRDLKSGREENVVLCGALCTTADVLVRDIPLSDPETGDLLAFENAGAYSITEGRYLFLSRDLPAVLFAEGDGQNEITLHRNAIHPDEINR